MTRNIASAASLRYLQKHPWLTALSILGIALGVAVVVAIDIANASAERAFELSTERVAGRATHQIVGASTIDDDVYRMLRLELGIRPSAPIVEGFVSRGGRTYQLLGIDPFADRPFRPYTSGLSTPDLGAFLGSSSTVLVPPGMDVSLNDTMHLEVGGRTEIVSVGGILVPEDEISREATGNLIIADVGTAQDILDMRGRLSRIDLILEDDHSLAAVLPAGVRVVRSSARTETVDQMTDAFTLNLNALSLLALVVAMFLIYNTTTFSVVQRRSLIGRLRALGMTRREIFLGVLLEAALLGLVGSIVGLLLGVGLAQVLVRLVTQTINDLYYVLDVRSVAIDTLVLTKGALLGVGATLVAAIPPAREAASAPVSVVLRRSEEELTARLRLPRLALAGLAAAAAGVVVLLASGRNLTISYVGLMLLLAAFALLSPGATRVLAGAFRRLLGAPFGLIGRMSAQGVIHNLSRTSVAVAALGIAVAATVGVGTMVGSFRDTVTSWLDYTLQADLYIQPPSAGVRLGQGFMDEEVAETIHNVAGVEAVSTVRRVELLLDGGRATLSAVEPRPENGESVRFVSGDREEILRAFRAGEAVLVSEPLAYRQNLGQGDTLSIPTDKGTAKFRVAGVYYDYGSDTGVITMNRRMFEQHYGAEGLSGISVYAERGVDLATLERRVRAAAGSDRRLVIRSNRGLREASLEIFDRTFAITTVLRILALLVAFGGVVSALMALQIERSDEFAVLRAEGMTPGQVRLLMTLQTGVMGAIAGILAIPLGLVLALVLVYVINKRSFGWTLEFSAPPEILVEAFAIALLAALVAGIYPSWRVSRSNTAEALRSP